MASVTGIGVWYPETVRKNDAWPQDFCQLRSATDDRTFNDIPLTEDAQAVTQHHLEAEARDPFLGSVERRVADDSTRSIDAEVAAGRAALEHAGIAPQDLDAIISYSMVPDRLMPAAATTIAYEMGARPNAVTFSMDAACATVVPQLATAAALVDSGAAQHVLLTQSHLLLRAFPMTHPAAPGLGDAASALVVSKRRRWPILRTHSVTSGEHYRTVTWIRGNQDETDLPWWKAGGDYRLGSRDRDAAKQLMRDTVSYGSRTLHEVCAAAGVDRERLTLMCSVQPRGWIPEAIAGHFGLRSECAVSTFDRYAHVGACGPVVNWHEAMTNGQRDGMVALYAQGAGFTRAAALISLDG